MRIGIGITTRNRPHYLESALAHYAKFGAGTRLVVVDDASSDQVANAELVQRFAHDRPDVDVLYRFSPDRLGIAKAKNSCLAPLRSMDHVFLMDDDCWPVADGWAERWVEVNVANNIGHSMWIINADAQPEKNPAFRAMINPLMYFGQPGFEMIEYNNCLGLMLYFSRACADAVGAFDSNVATVYGYEHAQISHRAAKAGFTRTPDRPYVSVSGCEKLVYSVDANFCMFNQLPPLETPWIKDIRTSVSPDEHAAAALNAQIMYRDEILIPLIDPFAEY